jgi:histidine triad (HIT) family protein
LTRVTDPGCVFCQIAAGRAPASVLYEDERVLAFMDIRPVNPGQFMVIPREHVDHFCDLADDLACHILVQAQRLSRNLRERLKPERVGLVVHGYGVAHAHLLVIPQHGRDDITSSRLAYLEGGQIKFGVRHLNETPPEELDRLARLLS